MIDKKQLENVEYFNHLGRVINDARRTREIKSRITVSKIACKQGENSFHQQIGLKFKKETSNALPLQHSLVWC